MDKLIITGGKKLSGRVKVPGGKNTVLPILAATLISGKKSEIRGCPKISDVYTTIDILKSLGCKVSFKDDIIKVDSSSVTGFEIKEDLMNKLRSSVVFMGALLARKREVLTSYPGGCELGLRPIDLHIKAFKKLNIKIIESHGYIRCIGDNMKEGIITLNFPSVGATENIMLVASKIKGKTTIINAAREPEIEDLADFLIKIGVKVKGAGTGIIEIEGTDKFYDCVHTLIPDRIVASTYMLAATVTKGEIEIENVSLKHLDAVTSAFLDMGTKIIKKDNNKIIVRGSEYINPLSVIRTSPYPGFPTDVQSILTASLCIAKGTSVVKESIFENRFKVVGELEKMGALISVNLDTATIKGVKKLQGAKVKAPDLRSGAALVVAALAAEGESEISNLKYIKRGYEDIVRDLKNLGAYIEYI